MSLLLAAVAIAGEQDFTIVNKTGVSSAEIPQTGVARRLRYK